MLNVVQNLKNVFEHSENFSVSYACCDGVEIITTDNNELKVIVEVCDSIANLTAYEKKYGEYQIIENTQVYNKLVYNEIVKRYKVPNKFWLNNHHNDIYYYDELQRDVISIFSSLQIEILNFSFDNIGNMTVYGENDIVLEISYYSEYLTLTANDKTIEFDFYPGEVYEVLPNALNDIFNE